MPLMASVGLQSEGRRTPQADQRRLENAKARGWNATKIWANSRLTNAKGTGKEKNGVYNEERPPLRGGGKGQSVKGNGTYEEGPARERGATHQGNAAQLTKRRARNWNEAPWRPDWSPDWNLGGWAWSAEWRRY